MGGSSALAEDQRNVTVVNGTGYGIKFLGFNNPGDNEWSDNELPPNSVLPDGNGVYVKFNTADDGCKWNFKIEWADPGYPGVVWHDLDLCSVSTVTLKYDRGDRQDDGRVRMDFLARPPRRKPQPMFLLSLLEGSERSFPLEGRIAHCQERLLNSSE